MQQKRISAIVHSLKEYDHALYKSDPFYVSDSQYKNICELFNKKLFEKLVYTGERITLPSRIGRFQIMKINTKVIGEKRKRKGFCGYRVDFNKTKQLKARGIDKVVKLTNIETNNFWWKLFWFKRYDANFKNKTYYCFNFTRNNYRSTSCDKRPEGISVTDYFRKEGYLKYDEFLKFL